jgi:DNA-binding MarR family transcriptional regulator
MAATTGVIARQLKQTRAFSSREQEVFLGLQIAAARIIEPWEKFLKTTSELTLNQYNVLRILRGSYPAGLPCGDIAERMIARDPDVTRLVDRLSRRGLVSRVRSRQDRRVVEVGITEKGREILRSLDEHVDRMPKAMLGHLGAKRLEHLGSLLQDVLGSLGAFPLGSQGENT